MPLEKSWRKGTFWLARRDFFPTPSALQEFFLLTATGVFFWEFTPCGSLVSSIFALLDFLFLFFSPPLPSFSKAPSLNLNHVMKYMFLFNLQRADVSRR